MLKSVGIGLASSGVRGRVKAAEKAEEAIKELPSAFSELAKEEQRRFVEATDSEYWFCVCFSTREEKDEFLRKSGLWDYGDKYLDGAVVAEKMGVKINAPRARFGQVKISARMKKLVG